MLQPYKYCYRKGANRRYIYKWTNDTNVNERRGKLGGEFGVINYRGRTELEQNTTTGVNKEQTDIWWSVLVCSFALLFPWESTFDQ